MSFVHHTAIRFAHCDPAGIAYYPRLFELVDAAIEDWTAAVLGIDRAAMHQRDRLGLPTVDLHAQFEAPCRLGEPLDIAVDVTSVGGSSVDLRTTATSAGTPRFAATLKQVLMNLDSARATAWPDAWRARLQP